MMPEAFAVPMEVHMFTSRPFALMAIAMAATMAAGCASMDGSQPDHYAAKRDCKAVPATFVDRPKKEPSSIEQAEARLKLGRLAAERGGTGGIGNNTLSDLNRDCY
jgi:hypothetical protein